MPSPLPEWTLARHARQPELDELYRRVEDEVLEAISWYVRDKRYQSGWSRTLRAVALLLAGAGAVLPLLSIATAGAVRSEWGYVVLGLAAATISFDRFFGFSTAWSRDMTAVFRLQALLSELQFDWLLLVASSQADHDVDRALTLLREYVRRLRAAVESETATWATEFSSNLTALDQAVVQGGPSVSPPLPPRAGGAGAAP